MSKYSKEFKEEALRLSDKTENRRKKCNSRRWGMRFQKTAAALI